MVYQADLPTTPVDLAILIGSGPEPTFDSVMKDFLLEAHEELTNRNRRASLLDVRSLGQRVPWLYRLTFQTKGHTQLTDGSVQVCSRHVVGLRILPDYLRRADQFSMLRLVEPEHCFHPNIVFGGICVSIYPGEPLTEICLSLHDLFRWRLRQYDERNALNPRACAWGRENISQAIDDRPLFGDRLAIRWDAMKSEAAGENR